MSDDPIQKLLLRFHLTEDRGSLAKAFLALRVEFVGPVASFLRDAPSSPRVEQVLCDLLVDLLGVTTDSPPRALAPEHHTSPATWRKMVLLNALRDHFRRERSYSKAVAAQSSEVSLTSTETVAFDLQIEYRQQRQRIAALLPRLDIRRRVAVAIELGMELPMAWVEELANYRGLSWSELLAHIRRHEAAPQDEVSKLQVLYGPEHELRAARDAYRQTVNRGCADLRQLLSRGRA